MGAEKRKGIYRHFGHLLLASLAESMTSLSCGFRPKPGVTILLLSIAISMGLFWGGPAHGTELSAAGLTPMVRTRIMEDIKLAFTQKYSLLSLKKARLKFDGLLHLDSCIAIEAAIEDRTLLGFEDRVLKCLAPFQDSHLAARGQTPRPYVVSGVALRPVGSKVIVAGLDPKVLNLNGAEVTTHLKLGSEVVKVDGRPIEEAIRSLAEFVSGSSQEFVRVLAVRALTLRDFVYPNRATVQLEFADGTSASLKWFVHPVALRQDIRDYLFSRLGLSSLPALKIDRRRAADGLDDGYVGYDERLSLADEEGLTYTTDSGSTAMRLGFMNLNNKRNCYLQMLNSTAVKVRMTGRPRDTLDRATEIAKFLKACQKIDAPMVLDLRRNPGGDFVVPHDDARAFLPPGIEVPSAFTTGRFTYHLRQAFDVFNLGPEFPLKPWSEFSGDRFYRAVIEAETNRMVHIPAIPERNLSAPTEAGFSLPMTVIISEYCISGCEIMVGLLKNRPNTRFVGTATNGTGGMMFHNAFAPITSGWKDEIYGSLHLRIPNTLFGILPATVTSGELLPFESIEDQILENRPLVPDQAFKHHLTINDILNKNADLRAVIERSLQ